MPICSADLTCVKIWFTLRPFAELGQRRFDEPLLWHLETPSAHSRSLERTEGHLRGTWGPKAEPWPPRRFRRHRRTVGRASSAPPASPTDLFARSWKLFLQQSGPDLGRLAPCLVQHWRKNVIPKCPSIFFPALATVGNAHEEMVGGMVDEA
jgi:hypothetical protein